MRKKSIWLKKLLAVSVCAAMAGQPAVTFGEDFSDDSVSVQETTGESTEGIDAGDAAVQEPEITEEPAAPEETDEPKAPGDQIDTSVFSKDPSDTSENPEENDEEETESLEQEPEDAELQMEDEDSLFSDGEASQAGVNGEKTGTCGKNVKWTLQNGVLTISGTGAMDDFYTMKDWWTGELLEQHEPEWDDLRDEIEEVYVQDSVTTIGTTAFANCYNLKKAVIGNSVTEIGHDAFANDQELSDLTVGNSVKNIYVDAFYGIKVQKLVLPASLTNIAEGALLGLWSLESIEIPDNGVYKSIDGALYKDGGKTLYMYPPKRSGEYTVPSSVKKIAEDAFTYTNLTKLTIPDQVTELGDDAVSYSETLKTLIIGKGIKTIPERCCWYCTALSEVSLPEGLTSIKDGAFQGCTALKEITIPSTVTNLEDAFEKTTKIKFAGKGYHQAEDGTYVSGVEVNVQAKECYAKAFEVLNLVNKERTKRGLSALKMDKSLLDTAMLRGFENVLYWDHTRPTGKSCFTANSKMFGENIAAGATTASYVMNLWMNSEGHKANILGEDFKSIGIGCVCTANGGYYWVQCFSYDDADQVSASSYKDQTRSRKVLVSKEKKYYKASLNVSATSLKKGQTATASVLWNGSTLSNSGALFKSSDPSVCTVDKNGKITALKAGTATISMYFDGYENGASTAKIKVTEPVSYVALTFNPNGGKVSTKSKTVKKNAKAGTLPTPSRKGYAFAGWYTAKSGGSKVTSGTKITGKKTVYAHWTKITVSKATISKVTNTSGRKLNVSAKSIKGVSGYQILYAQKSNFSRYKKVNTGKTTAVISNLAKNKTYYVKVRAYRKDSTGNYVYGAFSSVKKITIRK